MRAVVLSLGLALLYSAVCVAGQCQSFLGTWQPGLPRCDMQQQAYAEGSWKKVEEECRPRTMEDIASAAYPYEMYCNPTHHICNDETDTCRRKMLDMASWQWQPHSCNMQHFDAVALDQKLAGKRLAFVGDSIHLQQFFSLRHLMREVVAGTETEELWGNFHTHSGTVYRLVAAQFLVGQPCCNHFHNQALTVMPDAEWVENARNADILVLNTGHHWHRRDVRFDSYHTMVRNVLQHLKEEFTGNHIVFRTSSWGHHRCQTIKEPLSSLQEALNFGSLDNDPYHWMSPIVREHMWVDVANELGIGHKLSMVNASMTLLRGDTHLDRQMDADGSAFDDCLHYCMPAGPPDYWNWVLYNTLMSLDI